MIGMKQDKRVQKTEKGIRDAFISLLREKSFADITIRSIAERAQISRSTFYDHYADKYLLLETLYQEIIRRFQEMAGIYFAERSHEEKMELARRALDYVIGDAELIHVLMNMEEPGWDLTSRIQKAMEPMCLKYLAREQMDRYRLGNEFVAGIYTYVMTYCMKWIAEHQNVDDFSGILALSTHISSFFYEK